MNLGRKLQDLAADGAIAAIRRQRKAARAAPPPVLPRAWVETALADLVAVDVERWRRFAGTMSRTDRNGDAHWRLELGRGAELTTVPELVGWLVLTHDGTSGVEPKRFPATVSLVRTLAGWIEATIDVAGEGGGGRPQRGALRVPAPPREGVAGMVIGPTARELPRRWDGYPGLVTEVRGEVEFGRLAGGAVRLLDLAVVSRSPDELLLPVAPSHDGGPALLVRVRADAPLEDHAPEYVEGRWNRAEAVDREFRIERCTRSEGTLTLGGADWQIDLRARGLTVRVERVD